MNLKDEIVAGESYSLEFKRVPNEEREKYLKAVVAFANGKGGRILFGVANDRTVVGIPNERIFAEMDGIVNSISDACVPKIQVDLGVENIDGKAVIVLDVLAGAHCPYYLKSRGNKDGVYVRVGATTCVADDATRRELAFLSEGRSFDGELCPKAKIDEAAFATQMNVYRIPAPGREGNEGNREGNEGNRADNREDNHEPNDPNCAPNGTNGGTNGTNGGTNGTNQIVECVRKNPSISLDELSERIGVSRRTIVRMIDRMKKQGRIRRKGGTRGVWEVL